MEDLIGQCAQQYGIWVHKNVNLTTEGSYGSQGVATAQIPANTKLCSLPFSGCITPRLACDHFGISFEVISHGDLESAVLAAYLVEQRNASHSPWKVYLAALPLTFSSPRWWTEQDRQWLVGTNLHGEVDRRGRRMQDHIHRLGVIFQSSGSYGLDNYSIEEWAWAFEIIGSRSFPSSLIDSSASQQSHPILLPVLDTFNHKSPHAITWQSDHENRILSFLSGSPYEPGDQIYNNYGGKSNEEFLMSYGFCINDLQSDHVSLKLEGSNKTHYLTRTEPLPESALQEILETLQQSQAIDQVVAPNSLYARLRALHSFHAAILVKRDRLIESKPEQRPVNRAQGDATIYRDGQIELCHLAISASEIRILELLQTSSNGKQVLTLESIFQSSKVFSAAIRDCFAISSPDEADQAGLEDVLTTLLIWYVRKQKRSSDGCQVDKIGTEWRMEIEDIWQQIESCRSIVPETFGGLTEEEFVQAYIVQHRTFFEWQDGRYWIDPFGGLGIDEEFNS